MKKILQTETTANGKLEIGQAVGQSTRAFAAKLVVHPVIKGSNTGSDIVMHKAVVSSETISAIFANDARNPIEVEFTALLDTGNTEGVLGYIGTPA